jgi:uncharacterized coiled-coil protein SlyX
MTLEELLDDAKITDDMEIAFGDNKFKMADVRAADKKRRAKAENELKAVAAKQKELDELAQQAAALVDKLSKEPEKVVKTDGEIDWDADPIYGPVSKKMKPLESKMEEIANNIKTLQSSLAQSAQFVLQDFYDRRWNSVPEEKRKGKTWKEYLKTAAEKKILNEYGIADPVEALNRELEPLERNSLETKLAEANKKIEELSKSVNTPRMPRPGATGTGNTGANKGNDKVFDSADALVDAAFADPTIADLVANA